MKYRAFKQISVGVALAVAALVFTGCATISTNTRAFIGTPEFAPTKPESVKIYPSEPPIPKVRLGEVALSIEGNASRQRIEQRFRVEAARLGADGIFIASDKTHIFPVTYWDWWGPYYTSEYWRRMIVGVAFRHK